jgi:hypothetical protein
MAVYKSMWMSLALPFRRQKVQFQIKSQKINHLRLRFFVFFFKKNCDFQIFIFNSHLLQTDPIFIILFYMNLYFLQPISLSVHEF